MRTTIDSAGRIVIPRDIRNAIGLEAGTVVEISAEEGAISIEPAPAAVKIVKRGKLRIAVAESSPRPMPEDEVRLVREALRNRR